MTFVKRKTNSKMVVKNYTIKCRRERENWHLQFTKNITCVIVMRCPWIGTIGLMIQYFYESKGKKNPKHEKKKN